MNGEMVSVSINAKPIKYRYVFGILFLLLLSPFVFWMGATPVVTVYYSKEGKEELSMTWNTEHRIYRGGRGGLLPGEATSDFGHIFPDDDFFMEFYWWNASGRNHCVNITPKWRKTEIYLDANGDIDSSPGRGTDMERLRKCVTDPADP